MAIIPTLHAPMPRAPLTRAPSRSQEACALFIALGYSYESAAELLSIKPSTVRYHVLKLAAKIGGDLPPRLRVLVWMRGATSEVLTGELLRDTMERRLQEAANGRKR